MKVAKQYLIFSVFLFFYIIAISLLFRQFSIYQRAYITLSSFITNPSITVVQESFLLEKEDVMEKKEE